MHDIGDLGSCVMIPLVELLLNSSILESDDDLWSCMLEVPVPKGNDRVCDFWSFLRPSVCSLLLYAGGDLLMLGVNFKIFNLCESNVGGLLFLLYGL